MLRKFKKSRGALFFVRVYQSHFVQVQNDNNRNSKTKKGRIIMWDNLYLKHAFVTANWMRTIGITVAAIGAAALCAIFVVKKLGKRGDYDAV